MRHRNRSAIGIGAITEEAHLTDHNLLFAMNFTESTKECGVAIGIPGIVLPSGQLVEHHNGR
jgi:hypothetical protein